MTGGADPGEPGAHDQHVDVPGRALVLGKAEVALTMLLVAGCANRMSSAAEKMQCARWEAERPDGELHTPGTGRRINAIVSASKGLRRLLDDEPRHAAGSY